MVFLWVWQISLLLWWIYLSLFDDFNLFFRNFDGFLLSLLIVIHHSSISVNLMYFKTSLKMTGTSFGHVYQYVGCLFLSVFGMFVPITVLTSLPSTMLWRGIPERVSYLGIDLYSKLKYSHHPTCLLLSHKKYFQRLTTSNIIVWYSGFIAC
jgi:hypothetical protein